jgi:hypothetical protein
MEAAAEITSLFDSNGYLIEQATLKVPPSISKPVIGMRHGIELFALLTD